jgi:hypothetical protein
MSNGHKQQYKRDQVGGSRPTHANFSSFANLLLNHPETIG